ncbi:MAG: hypothetical protein AB1805_07815 [Nitrospirota bacterium]
MALEKVAARDRELLTLLRKWKGIEETTIRNCDAILRKSTNPIIGTLTGAIRSDSEKHRGILQLVIDGMTKKGFVLSPDDLAGVASLMNKHVDIEEKAIDMATEAVEMTRDPIAKQMLKLILEDEKRHKRMAEQMNELKFRITAKIT